MDNGGVTKEELSLLLSNDPKNHRESFEPVDTSTFIPRSKRHRRRKTWLYRSLPWKDKR
ncbi:MULTISPECIES: hypothetical protein [unclassified Paenibacillus]|uniref:hypothetical protein n=1 Tax=unclassified Paenibacillus TaxID=185978 RepID=UPI001AE6857C|nr:MULTISPECIES: hypothetical protein [unclassified Paenibacillus]MBP1156080.1 hypothetical protein [Paenibacillus sp. PvP091]MBP1168534.1 hypothetical protein [Paenibacillus sp. PvR098]MBP2439562.1 hypothetical protein [Paenibacillus sp. PvP052]